MTITLRDLDPPLTIGDWPLPRMSSFMTTDAYGQLRRDIQRYVDGEISGRSYLIAGHRGAGKTAIARRAVDDVRLAMLDSSIHYRAEVTSRRPLQRPLLVKLYGPSLIEPLVPTKAEQWASAAKAVAAANTAVATGQGVGATGEQAEADASLKATQASLVQITIALYRALAGELATGYAAHARGQAGRRLGEAAELAGQLALDLDTSTPPSVLRDYWRRVARLRLGVLWPRDADPGLELLALNDQGAREIVALATAGQAFEICSGSVTSTITNKTSATQDETLKAARTTDLKALIGQVGTLGVGTLTGAALWSNGPLAAVGLGALTWLIGSATIDWTLTRTRHREQSSDYVFLRDRSVQTLDRDLPLVIERIREAGLTPVFMVDELDKLTTPNETIGALIRRLKHIVADYGFFCFLTDRSYYDYVEHAVQQDAFPREHTYFSVRQLLAYSPREIADHVTAQLVLDPNATATERFACAVFPLWVAHKAKLNFAGVMRELGRAASAGEGLSAYLVAMTSRPDVLLAATVQLAINEVLASDQLRGRIAQDAGFAQLAHDALYFVSRCWEEDLPQVEMTGAALKTCLAKRMTAQGEPVIESRVDSADLELLLQANGALIDTLRDFQAFANRLAALTTPDTESQAAIVPVTLAKGLLRPKGRRGTFAFTFDVYGRDWRPNQGRADKQEVDDLVALVGEFETLMATLKISLDDLTTAGLLPANLSEPALHEDAAYLAKWSPAPFPPREATKALANARGLRIALEEQGEKLAAGLRLAQCLAVASPRRRTATLSEGLHVLGRYPVLGADGAEKGWTLEAWKKANTGYPDLGGLPRLTGDPEAVKTWVEDHAEETPTPAQSQAGSLAQVNRWAAWEPRFLGWFAAASSTPTPTPTARAGAPSFSYPELVSAMAGQPPAAVLRADPARIGRYEWSLACLAALPRRSTRITAPRWALVATMRALGFGAPFLKQLAEAPDRFDRTPTGEELANAQQIADTADRQARSAHLVVLQNGDHPPALAPDSTQPILYVQRSDLSRYRVELNWLQQLNAFSAVLYEDEDESDEAQRPRPA